jgi:ElaB/YqjD/DUF883 family membrane-anchored ribosome-binding protein
LRQINFLENKKEVAMSAQANKVDEIVNSPLELSTLKQKAMDLMQKGGEEISHRYADAFEDMKDVSKRVQEQMKDKPYQIAMSAAGVVGLGMVLVKRLNQRRGKLSTRMSTPT